MINDLTMKIGKNIDFSQKYQKILENYPADRRSSYRLNIDEVTEYIQSLGYSVRYYKSARFFRVDIGKCSNGEDVYCDFTVSDSRYVPLSRVNALITIRDKSMKTARTAGYSMPLWYKEINGIKAENDNICVPHIKNRDELENLLRDIFDIAEDCARYQF